MKILVNYNLYVEVDVKKDDCLREPAHCHVVKNGRRVAQVWLNSVTIEGNHNLDRNEVRQVIDVVNGNRYKLVCEYNNNRVNGAD